MLRSGRLKGVELLLLHTFFEQNYLVPDKAKIDFGRDNQRNQAAYEATKSSNGAQYGLLRQFYAADRLQVQHRLYDSRYGGR